MATRKYKNVSCHKTIGAAKKAAKKLRDAGKTARVVKKSGGGACVESAGKRKKRK